MKKTTWLLSLYVLCFTLQGQPIKVNYVNAFENSNHPEVAYWFITDKMMVPKKYKEKIDSFAAYSKYTLVFLTQRDNCDFYDAKSMYPFFKGVVAYAHQKGLKIGLQIWKSDKGTRVENTDRLMQEGEVQLDDAGKASYSVKAKGARNMNTLLKSELFRIYAFKKTGDGFYDPATLRVITGAAKVEADTSNVQVSLNAGAAFKGYTAYILTQHYYNSCSNFSEQARSIMSDAFKAYSDIPFDGIGLDEYKNLQIARSPILVAAKDVFRERLYSLDMAKRMKAVSGFDLDRILFDMRYAPSGNAAVRIQAINVYMALLRTATLGIETMMYDLGKKLYGKNTFIGLHDTYHNNLDRDEVWQTGVSWWNIKRDYGHTDENTAIPIELGVGMSYAENAMYNMYYDKSLDKIWTKALYDLRYGVRTHYHAANDVQGWGVSIDDPAALVQINKVENAARLLNRFNPPFPQAKILVVYGMEALFNWYPNVEERGLYDIREKLDMDKKSMLLWNNGYINASVPTDLIEDGRLKLNTEGKPVLNGYVFDAVVFLYPQYAKGTTTKFIQDYISKGGKLLIEGEVTHDFHGRDISEAWKAIAAKAVATSFSLDNVAKLGVPKTELIDGVANGDGMFTFTSIESIKDNSPANFSFSYKGNSFSGKYKGLAAIKVDTKGNLQKLAATGFSTFSRNGKEIFHTDKEADVFISFQEGEYFVTIADAKKSIKIYQNK
jgi:hypothetical protein